MIIHDIYRTKTFVVEFLHSRKSWCARKQTRPRATLVDPMFIEKSEEDKVVEQHLVETQVVQKDVGEENVVEVEV